MYSNILSDNKASYSMKAADYKHPLKKVHCISNKMIVVIDEILVKHLQINENDTWFEQIPTEDGILLRKHQYSQNRELKENAR